MPGIPDTNPRDDRGIGVIIPPAEIRKIADKTAEYVAKNGSAFEEIVQRSEANNPKFSFLKPHDPYRAYFEQKVIEFAQGIVPEQQATAPQPEPVTVAPIVQQKKDIKKELRRDVKPPQADKYTVEPNTSISLLDMDVIKLSAQFVAKNGQKFLLALTEREKQNPMFDFLKPTHQLFSFFTNLVGAYSECSNPSRKDVERIRQNANEKMAILNAAGERFEFEQQQTQLKKTKDDREDEERAQMAQIDWNDFVIVETIDLFDDEALPAPSNFSKPDVRTMGPEVETYRGQSSAEPATAFPQAQPLQRPSETAAEADIKVKKDYVRKAAPGDSATNKCPICNQYIPVSEFNEHLRIEMLDPNYKNVKADVQARAENITMVSGDEIAQNLRNMTRNMPTVYGSGEDRRDDAARGGAAPKLIWDGQSGTMTRTTANQAMIAQQQKKNYDEQMRVVQEKLVEPQRPMPVAGPALNPMVSGVGMNRGPAGPHLPQDIARNLGKPAHDKPEISGGEGTKKVRTEEANLVPEEIWLMTSPGSVTVKIIVPNIEEANIQQKEITATFDPKTTIQAVKQHISAQLGGLPAAKMTLRTKQQSVLRDEPSLAYYNILNEDIYLGLKNH